MRNARKALLLAVMALAAMAFSASTASAVEITQEGTGHCAAVVAATEGVNNGSGGCVLHATSTSKVELGSPLGMALCDNEFEARVDENGEGFIYSQAITACTGNPSDINECTESGVDEAWPAHLNSATSMEATFCIEAFFDLITVNCHLGDIEVIQTAHDSILFSTDDQHQVCENDSNYSVDGDWRLEFDASHPTGEITE